jgi:hypothetical protein
MAGNMAAAVAATAVHYQPRRPQSRQRCQTFGTSKRETTASCVPKGFLRPIGNRQIRPKTASRSFRNIRRRLSGCMPAAFFDGLSGTTYMLISTNPSPEDGARNMRAPRQPTTFCRRLRCYFLIANLERPPNRAERRTTPAYRRAAFNFGYVPMDSCLSCRLGKRRSARVRVATCASRNQEFSRCIV